MLSIGRALMGNPTLLLMDEPLEGLAPVIVEAVLAGLDRLKREDDLAILLVEQHARIALEFAEDAIVLDRGRIVYRGPSRDAARGAGAAQRADGRVTRRTRRGRPLRPRKSKTRQPCGWRVEVEAGCRLRT